jgi:hypothetical protein
MTTSAAQSFDFLTNADADYVRPIMVGSPRLLGQSPCSRRKKPTQP